MTTLSLASMLLAWSDPGIYSVGALESHHFPRPQRHRLPLLEISASRRLLLTKFCENDRKKDLNLSGFYECRTGLTDAFDFTRKRAFGHFLFVSIT
jgi:hypothetical protein